MRPSGQVLGDNGGQQGRHRQNRVDSIKGLTAAAVVKRRYCSELRLLHLPQSQDRISVINYVVPAGTWYWIGQEYWGE